MWHGRAAVTPRPPAALTHFHPEWRAAPEAAFDIETTTTGQGTHAWTVGDRTYRVYRNVNLSVYSGQICNARCPFCVEELRPASRGRTLDAQRATEPDDACYFTRLEAALTLTRPLDPSLSITGGEPSLDPRLPGILARVSRFGLRKRTLTTNASGLLLPRADGGPGDVLDVVLGAGLAHLNISRAHWNADVNQRVMRIRPPQTEANLRTIVSRARDAGARPRLSCVLLAGAVHDLESCRRYLDWAAGLGVDNVVFRQLMRYDPVTHRPNAVTLYTDAAFVPLGPLLEALRPTTAGGGGGGRGRRADGDGGGSRRADGDPAFAFTRHVLGYYYSVEVFRYAGPAGPMDVCFEGADLALIERRRVEAADASGIAPINELVFHPDGALCSTWQPWDGRVA